MLERPKHQLYRVFRPRSVAVIGGSAAGAHIIRNCRQIGFPGEASLGTIVTGALEQSTVDIADELTSMIEAQRSYTANSKVHKPKFPFNAKMEKGFFYLGEVLAIYVVDFWIDFVWRFRIDYRRTRNVVRNGVIRAMPARRRKQEQDAQYRGSRKVDFPSH